jgi:hypothetical protein
MDSSCLPDLEWLKIKKTIKAGFLTEQQALCKKAKQILRDACYDIEIPGDDEDV